jgi:hypothetical protein
MKYIGKKIEEGGGGEGTRGREIKKRGVGGKKTDRG